MNIPSTTDQPQNTNPQTDPQIFKKYIVGVDDSSGSKDYIIGENMHPTLQNFQSADGSLAGPPIIHLQDQLLLDQKNEEELIQKLRVQNAAYREELKSLSEQLTALISRHKITKTETLKQIATNTPDHNQEDRIVMEIESGKKSIAIYKKELKQLKSKYEDLDNPTKRAEMEDKAFAINLEIEKESAAKKQLSKLIRDKSKQIEQFQGDAVVSNKEGVLFDDLKAIKDRFRQVTFNETRLANQAQSREAYASKLEKEVSELKESYRVAADKTGYVERPAKIKVRSISRGRGTVGNNPMILPSTTSPWKAKEDEVDLLAYDEENFVRLSAKLKIMKKADTGKEKVQNREIQELESQVSMAERDWNWAKESLTDREKEIDELTLIFNELSSLASQHNIPLPAEERKLTKKRTLEKGSLTSRTQENVHLPTISSRGQREEKEMRKKRTSSGENIPTEPVDFNDREIIGNHNVKICGIRIWYDGKRLNGIQGLYKTHSGRKFEGKKHVKDQYKYKVSKFEMEGDDFLKDVSGHLNAEGDTVECLMFKSFYGESRKVGQASENSRLFRFDIAANEFPAIFYGTTREDEGGCVLAKLGVLIGSDEVRNSDDEGEEGFFEKTSVPSKRSSQMSIM